MDLAALGFEPQLAAYAAVWALIVGRVIMPAVRTRRPAEDDPEDGPFTGRRLIPKLYHKPIVLIASAGLAAAFGVWRGFELVDGALAGVVGSYLASVGHETRKGVKEMRR